MKEKYKIHLTKRKSFDLRKKCEYVGWGEIEPKELGAFCTFRMCSLFLVHLYLVY